MVKYYGRWVLVRVWGIEEPLAALGMVLTFCTHLIALIRLRARANHPSPPALPDAFPLAAWYSLAAFVWAGATVTAGLECVRHTPQTALASSIGTHIALIITLFQAVARLGRWASSTGGESPPFPRYATAVLQNARRFRLGVRLVLAVLVLEALAIRRHWLRLAFFSRTNTILAPLTWITWFVLTVRPHLLSGSSPLCLSAPSTLRLDSDEPVGGTTVVGSGRRASLRRLRSVLLVLLVDSWLKRTIDVPPLHRTLDVHAAWALTLPVVAIMWHTALSADAISAVESGYWTNPKRLQAVAPQSSSTAAATAPPLTRSLIAATALLDRGSARASQSVSACVSLVSCRVAQYAAKRRAVNPDDKLAALLDPDSAEGAAVALADTIGLTKALPELKILGRPEMVQAVP